MKIEMKLYSAKSSRNPVHQVSGEVADSVAADLFKGGVYKSPLVDADASMLKLIEKRSDGAVKGMAFVLAEMAQCGTGAPIWKGCRPSARIEIRAV